MTTRHTTILLVPALLAGCSLFNPQRPAPPPAAPAGLSIEEEAQILRLEDRREYDPPLTHLLLTSPNPLARARIALALAHIGPHVFVDANNNGEKDPGEKQLGVELLAPLIADDDVDVRRNAAFALGEIGDPSAADALFQFATDSHADVATEAVEALSKLAPNVSLERYHAFIDTEAREGVRMRAVSLLFRFASDDASRIAADLLGDSSPTVREHAAYALSRRPYAPARPQLELLLTDTETRTRANAARALGVIGDPASVSPLVASLLDAHPWVRTNVLRALTQIATKDPAAIRTVELLRDANRVISLTDDTDPGTRAVAVETLGWYAPINTAARDRLIEISTSGTRWQREIAGAAIAVHLAPSNPALLERVLKDAEPADVRGILAATAALPSGAELRRRYITAADAGSRALAVGSIPDDQVNAEIGLIRAALDDPDPVVRANAIDRYAIQTVDSREATVDALRKQETRATDEPLNDARLSAVAAIGGLDDPGREAFLRQRVQDRDPVVRRMSAELLRDKLGKNLPAYTPLPIDRPLAEYVKIAQWAAGRHTATIRMPRGNIELILLTGDAPMTAWNFAQLAQKHFFDNTTFMRVVPNFVLQGGDPRNDQNGGPGYSIRDEMNLQKYTRGAVGMALSGPDTGGSQFFITHSPQPHLDGGYTIFARVIRGMSGVADQVERGDKVTTITIDSAPAPETPDTAAIEARTPVATKPRP